MTRAVCDQDIDNQLAAAGSRDDIDIDSRLEAGSPSSPHSLMTDHWGLSRPVKPETSLSTPYDHESGANRDSGRSHKFLGHKLWRRGCLWLTAYPSPLYFCLEKQDLIACVFCTCEHARHLLVSSQHARAAISLHFIISCSAFCNLLMTILLSSKAKSSEHV